MVELRYGWPLDDVDCCPQMQYSRFTALGFQTAPCPPAACPIKGATTLFPMNPFRANITAAGKCQCTLPQVCSA